MKSGNGYSSQDYTLHLANGTVEVNSFVRNTEMIYDDDNDSGGDSELDFDRIEGKKGRD